MQTREPINSAPLTSLTDGYVMLFVGLWLMTQCRWQIERVIGRPCLRPVADEVA